MVAAEVGRSLSKCHLIDNLGERVEFSLLSPAVNCCDPRGVKVRDCVMDGCWYARSHQFQWISRKFYDTDNSTHTISHTARGKNCPQDSPPAKI